ncbi:SGNH/GDSL hydrolase family protein [Phytohabitans rumicis]|uniref:Lipoprotein n=1 Tax=Phytohabitans rumicis TaxID=1076125 RepID=A0A6V8LAY5_9ACTN|nr:SGNH/GDSL hydrolase family protein [Phytohabitans rumicis]GFJ92770.1 lipoprotein [Phytohabitans rumicis]
MRRRWTTVLLALAAIAALACEEGGGAIGDPDPTPRGDLPSSMAALGDSITSGFGACLTLIACTRHSWSTGESLQVNSHYRRLRKANKAIDDKAYNYSVPGARVSGLQAQANKAVRAKVEYVTVLIGANDVCRDRVENMTPVDDFRQDLDKALGTLKKGLPKARVLVVSIPDLNRLWEIGHTEARAVRAWSNGICPALLANPTSTAGPDASRRSAVGKRVDAYNSQLAAACKAYGSRCEYDKGAAHKVKFTLDMVNRLDWFHPDSDGQKKLAEVTYPGQFQS